MNKVSLEETKLGYDVIIVGAGPAGCIAGHFLNNGFSTLVINSKKLPRNKLCGGVLVKEAQKFLEEYNPPSTFKVKPYYLDVKYVNWATDEEKLVKKDFLNIDRNKFDEWLSTLLDKENISIGDGIKLVDFTYTKDKKHLVVILEENGSLKPIVSKYLIGCDGALSKTREIIEAKRIPYYIGIQETMKGTLDSAYFIYDESITDFYSWLIPKGDEIVVGSALQPYKAMEKFKLFKEKVRKKYGIKNNGKISFALLFRPRSKSDIFLGDSNVLLAGEAAGLISPSSAEGISFALQSGKFCAEAMNAEPNNPMKIYKEKCGPLLERMNLKFHKIGLKSKILALKLV